MSDSFTTPGGQAINAPPRRASEPVQGKKLRDGDKLAHIPVKVIASDKLLRKPEWIRIKVSANPAVDRIKKILRKHALASVCEEASCPNLGECFSGGTATFMVMGDICTRRCPFCDVGHGKPNPLDPDEPRHLAEAIAEMALRYVVITSVDRDDLRDGGAEHIAHCVRIARELSPGLQVEILTPDFRGRMEVALDFLAVDAPGEAAGVAGGFGGDGTGVDDDFIGNGRFCDNLMTSGE